LQFLPRISGGSQIDGSYSETAIDPEPITSQTKTIENLLL
jgi:hypothetical protein